MCANKEKKTKSPIYALNVRCVTSNRYRYTLGCTQKATLQKARLYSLRTGEDSTICQADRTGHLGDRQEEEEEDPYRL
jgi:hypothetical protein